MAEKLVMGLKSDIWKGLQQVSGGRIGDGLLLPCHGFPGPTAARQARCRPDPLGLGSPAPCHVSGSASVNLRTSCIRASRDSRNGRPVNGHRVTDMTGRSQAEEANRGRPSEADKQWMKSFPAYMLSKDQGFKAPGDSIGETQGGEADAASPLKEAAASKKKRSGTKSRSTLFTATPPEHRMPEPDVILRDPIWGAIRAEARLEAEKEPLLSSFLYASILSHPCLEHSLGFVLANRLKSPVLLATQLMEIFDDVMVHDMQINEAIRGDIQAVRDRDPSCGTYSAALLYLKGFHALQAYRISHVLWQRGQRILATALQSRISEIFAVDIHPAARIGKGILLDHGTGVVIGETAVVEDHVSMLQGVTLGGTGKECGDRHPKIGPGVLIGAGATVLGNIKIGAYSMIAAGSLVLKDVPPHSLIAGTPARAVGTLPDIVPALTMKHDVAFDFCQEWEQAVRQQAMEDATARASVHGALAGKGFLEEQLYPEFEI